MAYQIVRVFHFDDDKIGTSSRSVLPNVYETAALAWKLAGRKAAALDEYVDDETYHVCVAGDVRLRPVSRPRVDDSDDIAF